MALLLVQAVGMQRTAAVLIGLLVFAALSTAFYAFERWRFETMKPKVGPIGP